MLQGVKCTVSNCKYWESGEHCDASAIEVNVDGRGNSVNQSKQTVKHFIKSNISSRDKTWYNSGFISLLWYTSFLNFISIMKG